MKFPISYIFQFNTLLQEVLCSRLRGIPGNAADLVLLGQVLVCENGADDRATLVASGTENSDEFGHVGRQVVS